MTTRAHGIDISKYDQFFYPEQATGQLDFVIQRVSYGVTRDELFDKLTPAVMRVPVRMAYHYLSSWISYKQQVDALFGFIAGYDYHAIIFDFESAFNTMNTAFAKLAWDAIQYAKQKTTKRVILYTNTALYNAYIYPSQAIYFLNWNNVPLWQAAWWNTPNPDANPINPNGRTTGWQLWQYTNRGDGSLYGCAKRTEFDLDVYNGTVNDLRAWLGISNQPDVTVPSPDGMTHITGARNDWKFHLFKLDPAKYRFELVSTPALETVPSVAKRKGALLATNAGEWARETLKPQDYTVSNTVEIVTRDKIAARPSLHVMDFYHQVVIGHTFQVGVQQAFTGLRYIVGSLAEPTKWNTEGHARTCFGLDEAGNMMILLSEGIHPSLTVFDGLKLVECATLLKQYGAVVAFDGGGGGDAGGVLDGVDLIKPENISNGANVYRALPMTLCVYPKGVSTMYGKAKESQGNSTRVRIKPSRYASYSTTLPIGATVDFIGKVPALPATALTPLDKAGEMWLELPDHTFVNYKLYNTSGVLTEMFTILQEPTAEPAPTAGDISFDAVLRADGTITGTWKNV